MIYLILAIASSALVSLSLRASEGHIQNKYGMLLVNYVICAVASALYMNKDLNYLAQSGTGFMLGIGVVNGLLYLGTLLMMQYSTTHNGVVLSSTFMKLGVLIPTIMAIALFGEQPKGTQIAGIIFALIAIVMLQFEKGAFSQGNKKWWLLLLLVGGGITDSLANVYEQYGNPAIKDGFLLVTFLIAGIFAAVLTFSGGRKLSKSEIIYGAILGVPNYFSARFLLLALGDMAAVIAYPTYSVGTMITITLIGVLVFKEYLNKKKAAALAMIVLAICLLNL